ncbi:MAG TPA: efflux RND transporter permease subunit, partial [Thermoanaerobaculia bacterium]|nr:efflux RND transporter permease subunit [Thermoanaerobaculia bacterium]
MFLSDVSIRRPVFATVMNILVVVAGSVAYFALPVREYPDIDFPVVNISTVYFGASPETIEATIVEPIEQVLNGIEGIRTITSTSGFSVGSINIEFKAGRDIDLAATDVSNAVQQALGELPPEAEKPVITKAGSEFQPIIWFSLTGEKYSAIDRTDAGERIIRPALQLLPGVARVRIGGRRFAMRVWLDPAKMAARGVTAGDVRRAILENNLQVPAGALEAEARRFVINLDAQLDDPRDYERLVIRRDGDHVVRVADVGWVELGAEDYSTLTRAMGRQTVGVGIVRQSRANELEVSKAVHARIPEIERSLPEGMTLALSTDNTIFVEATLKEVWKTLAIAFGIVVLVNLFFLRSKATTIITSIAIPISVVGTFAVMEVAGFSINVLTLLALVLVIGMVVDDSIVVLENIFRRQELGEPPRIAALNGAKEVGFPVVATTLSIVAVLVPLSLMTGNTGRLFREFALTMAAAILISLFVSLTVVPMACSRFLTIKRRHGAVWRWIESLLRGAARAYERLLAVFLRQRVLVAVFFVACLAGTAWLVRAIPRTLVPVEDRGAFMTIIRAPQGSTAAYTDRALRQVEEALFEIPELQSYFAAISFGFGGPGDTSQGIVFTRLSHWDERKVKQQDIVARLFPRFMAIPEALVFPVNPSSLGQGSRSSDVQIAIKSSAADLEEFNEVGRRVVGRLSAIPGLVNVDTDMRLDNPQLDIVVDRERASDLGVSVADIAESMRLLVSQGRIDDFILRAKQYDVVTALASRFRTVPEQLGEIHLRAANGAMVPMSTVARAVPRIGAASLTHYDLQRSVTVTANLAPGATLGDVLPPALAAVNEELPPTFTTALGGASREFIESAGAIYLTFGVGLLVVYLVLAAQFESFLHPFTVMLSVPLATLGALGAIYLLGYSLNIYTGIGLILLVGLVTKNGILLVEFANQERARGADLMLALSRAGAIRFRPILMTSVTSILG